MAELKTKPNDASVQSFIESIDDEQKRDDSYELVELMKKITGEEPRMWGSSIVGFGNYHYVYPTGNEGDWMLTGFSPRKQALTIYIMAGLPRYEKELSKIGKHKNGKSCLYVKKLDDVDKAVLTNIIKDSIEYVKELY